jgi:hypothetical protein
VSGFLIPVPKQMKPISSSSLILPSSISSSQVVLRQQQAFDNDSDDDDDDDDDVFLTPIQIRSIRKDIIRKRANHKLPTIYYNQHDDDDNHNDIPKNILSVEQQIVEALIANQLVQVRGIALQDNDTRTIRNEAEQLAYRIQKRIQRQQQEENDSIVESTSKISLAYVFVVEMKGHMATLFYYIPQQQLTTPFHQLYQKTNTAVLSSSPSGSASRLSPKVQLRTTGKRNDWKKRPKPLRDNAGQIIK